MKRAATALTISLLAIGLVTPTAGTSLQSSATTSVTIPFEIVNRHIMVKVRVNKSRPLSFLFDTGAYGAIVRMNVAKELGLSLRGNVNVGGAGAGTQAGSLVKDARWSLVGLERLTQPVALALPLPELPHGLGGDVDGIIGSEFVKQFVLELDYQANRITLHDRDRFVYKGPGETLPLDFNADGHPIVQATVTPLSGTPITARFMLDTGSGGRLVLHSPFVLQHSLLGGQSTTIRAIGGMGAGGRALGRHGRVASLTIGSFNIGKPITLFSEDKAGAFANAALAGNIGGQIASRFRMFLDYGRRRIILEPSSTFDEPFNRAFSGIALRAEGEDYRTFRVREVLEDSPASEAGIAVDDVITSIDGVGAESLTLTAIIEMLEKPAARELTIRRGAEVLKVSVTPRQLI